MTVTRGDVLLARFPHFKGGRGKRRPVVVVQADHYNALGRSVLVAEITSNLTFANDPAFLTIDVATPDGQATGLQGNSLVSCLHLATLDPSLLGGPIGKLSASMLVKLNYCLKASLELP